MGARTRPFGEDAAAALGALDRLGARAAALGATLRGLDDRRLLAERRRLVGQMGATPEGPVHAELRRSAAALDDQLAVRRRLQDARTATLARLQSGTLDLERLAARLAEVVSLTAAGGERGPGQLDGVAEELEWLRRGLLEVGAADAEAATPAALSSTMSEQDAKLIDERPAAIGQPGGP